MDIKQNGFYQLEGITVLADCIGLLEFKACVMAPVTINLPFLSGVQVFADPNGVLYARIFSHLGRTAPEYQPWIKLGHVDTMQK